MGELKTTINSMVRRLSNFASQVNKVAREVGTEGKLGVQAHVVDVDGIWREVTTKVNNMAKNLTDQVRAFAMISTAAALGDFSSMITVDAMGEMDALKSQINRMVMSLRTSIDSYQQSRDEAIQANRAKSEFLANMSHEVRTPLNGILGMTSATLETNLTHAQRDSLLIVSSLSNSLLSILDDLLDLSKIEAGRMSIENIQYTLRSAINGVLKAVSLKFVQKGLGISLHCDSDVPDDVIGDPHRLRQIMTNLVGNALKFTNEGGVGISCRVAAHKPGNHAILEVSVSDTGIGIQPDKLTVIFDSFAQADGSTTRKYGGTGLGLSISKRLCELMGGDIRVESEYGVGSKFIFTVDIEVPVFSFSHYERRILPYRNRNVLIIHDPVQRPQTQSDVSTLRVLLARFHLSSATVESADHPSAMTWRGAQGRQIFDTIIVDSLETADRLRSSGVFNLNIMPIVYFPEPWLHGVNMNRVIDLGICAILDAPFTFSKVANAILPALESHSLIPDLGKFRRRPLHVLLAEDNVVNQKLALRILQKCNHKVEVVSNGDLAVEAVVDQWQRNVAIYGSHIKHLTPNSANSASDDDERASSKSNGGRLNTRSPFAMDPDDPSPGDERSAYIVDNRTRHHQRGRASATSSKASGGRGGGGVSESDYSDDSTSRRAGGGGGGGGDFGGDADIASDGFGSDDGDMMQHTMSEDGMPQYADGTIFAESIYPPATKVPDDKPLVLEELIKPKEESGTAKNPADPPMQPPATSEEEFSVRKPAGVRDPSSKFFCVPMPYDIILMDVQMPVMGGFESTNWIRAWEEGEGVDFRTPIIALTAHAMLGDRERCLAAGMDEYVTKPLRFDELLSTIDRFHPRMYTESGEIVPINPPEPSEHSSDDGNDGNDDEDDDGGNNNDGSDGSDVSYSSSSASNPSSSDDDDDDDIASDMLYSVADNNDSNELSNPRLLHHHHHKQNDPLNQEWQDARDRSVLTKEDDPSNVAYSNARAMVRDRTHEDIQNEDIETRVARQNAAAQLLRKHVDMYKLRYGSDLANLPGMEEVKSAIKKQEDGGEEDKTQNQPKDREAGDSVSSSSGGGGGGGNSNIIKNMAVSRSVSLTNIAAGSNIANVADEDDVVSAVSVDKIKGSDTSKGRSRSRSTSRISSGDGAIVAVKRAAPRVRKSSSQPPIVTVTPLPPVPGHAHHTKASAHPDHGTLSLTAASRQAQNSAFRTDATAVVRSPKSSASSSGGRILLGGGEEAASRFHGSKKHGKSRMQSSNERRRHNPNRQYDYRGRNQTKDIYGVDYGSNNRQNPDFSSNYLDVPRHSIIDPTMLSFDLPGELSTQPSYGRVGTGNHTSSSSNNNHNNANSNNYATGEDVASGGGGGGGDDDLVGGGSNPLDGLHQPKRSNSMDAGSSVNQLQQQQYQQNQQVQDQQSRKNTTSAWSIAKPIGESFLPSATSTSAPGVPSPLAVAAASSSLLLPSIIPTEVSVGGVIPPRRTYMRLDTTADVAAAMDAAAAGDKNALRAIQATGMQSDLDDTPPTEPAYSRTGFPTHGLMGSDQPLPPQQKQSYAASPPPVVPSQPAMVEKPRSQQVKLSQNVRDRLIKARMKQKQSQQKRQQQQNDDDEKNDA
ncbi:histidine kinase osmosensor [Coemansia sp. IMI 209127]|nr:histidine kinase osmosensor [Coemansia sp. IMI 209127]